MFYKLFRNFLFFFSPETSHYLALKTVKVLLNIPGFSHLTRLFLGKPVEKEVKALGLTFKNGVGLAAGFDKNAQFLDVFEAFGFGFVEVGTVTPKPQSGNDKPRLFRLKKSEGLINRMGFNNHGVDAMVEELKKYNGDMVIGGNIGKNKITPNENAADDYLICFEKLYPWVDYLAVNVSSPNTPNLRELQDKKPLTDLLKQLAAKREEMQKNYPIKPVLLKIAPDLNEDQLREVVEIVNESGINGIIATNTTIERKYINEDAAFVEQIGAGGLSGKPVFEKSTDVLKTLQKLTAGKMPLIGVGGINNTNDARAKLDNGASLVQIYTGFIYHGPALVKECAEIF